VGMATAGIPHASLIGDRLGVPVGYVESDGEVESANGRVANLVQAGRRAVMIEDHITTGGSVIKTAQALRAHGVQIDHCVAIFTYNRPVVWQNFEAARLRLTPLCDLETLLDVAVGIGRVGEAEREVVYDWRRDPREWAARRSQPHAGTT